MGGAGLLPTPGQEQGASRPGPFGLQDEAFLQQRGRRLDPGGFLPGVPALNVPVGRVVEGQQLQPVAGGGLRQAEGFGDLGDHPGGGYERVLLGPGDSGTQILLDGVETARQHADPVEQVVPETQVLGDARRQGGLRFPVGDLRRIPGDRVVVSVGGDGPGPLGDGRPHRGLCGAFRQAQEDPHLPVAGVVAPAG